MITFKNCKFTGISKPPLKWSKGLNEVEGDIIFENEHFYCYNGDEFYTFNNKKPWYKFW